MNFEKRDCPVCGGTDFKNIGFVREFGKEGPIVSKCKACGMVFQSKTMTDLDNKLFYDQNRQKKFVDSILQESYESKIFTEAKRRIYACSSYIFNKSVLDVGCGYASFVENAESYTKKICGIDVSSERISKAKEQNSSLNIQNIEISDLKEKFDAVTAFHVLEHIKQPIHFLYSVRKRLGKKGNLIIEVPNINDLLVKWPPYKKFYFQAAHCNYFSSSSLSRLLGLAGFKVIKDILVQRYSLDNHLYWLMKRKPGRFAFSKSDFYDRIVKSLGMNDTIFFICEKEK
jgi:2-polyprenyl-3-methyl-5-hydroxy-6-metoxy-1,4-benzoquinol methylase